jgi:hypothetical protein
VTGAEMISAAGLIVTALLGLGVYINNKRSNRTAETRNQVDAGSQLFDNNIELAEYVDKRIAIALQPVQAELDAFKEWKKSTNAIIRRFFRQLITWDRNGRAGQMPMPSAEDMTQLEIEDLHSD